MPTTRRLARLPAFITPQLATLVRSVPAASEAWRYEVKLDGYRVLARIERGQVRLLTRNGNDWTHRCPPVVEALAALKVEDAWIDGELVVLDERGRSDFQRLQRAFDAGARDIVFVAFDLPWLDGEDLRAAPQQQRRQRLAGLLPARLARRVRLAEEVGGAPQQLLDAACRMGLEGLIAKRADAPYEAGRSRSWLKLKCQPRQEFVVVGFTEPQGSRRGVGALLLGVHDADGTLRYAGRTGSGFDTAQLQSLRRMLDAIEVDAPALARAPRAGNAVHWVRPTLVAEVAFAEWTADGLLRQAVFKGLRGDKPAAEITQERPADMPDNASATSSRSAAASASASAKAAPRRGAPTPPSPGRARAPEAAAVEGVRITHPERVIDPDSGVTKLELARYLASVAPLMLPHLDDRPVALVRAPEGLGGERFFQKHLARLVIPRIKQLDPALDPGHPPLLEIDSAAALVGAAQMGTVEFHAWNATHGAIEKPDRVVFDLDPDPALPWARVLEATELLKNLLDELQLQSFVKTSGGRGLHVLVPIARRHGWDAAKGFAQAVAQQLARSMPERFSARMGAENRVGKVFVDYLRNTRGATAACTYSPRARPGLPVSVPVGWDELVTLKSGAQWTVRTLARRLAEREGHDPWEGWTRCRQTLSAATRHLQRTRHAAP